MYSTTSLISIASIIEFLFYFLKPCQSFFLFFATFRESKDYPTSRNHATRTPPLFRRSTQFGRAHAWTGYKTYEIPHVVLTPLFSFFLFFVPFPKVLLLTAGLPVLCEVFFSEFDSRWGTRKIFFRVFDLRSFLHSFHFIQVTTSHIIYSHLSFRHI